MKRMLLSALAIMFLLVTPVSVYAQSLSQDDANSIYGDTVWYDLSGGSGGSVTCLSGGSLPSAVPEPYNKIFTAAANKFHIPPALLAALFYAGEHGSSWPNPPAPYGTGGPWASSSAGAQGPFQFLPSTWAAYGVDGNGDGKTDIQDLWDAAFGAAKLLGADGAANTTDEQAIKKAIYDYNHSQDYVTAVWGAYVKFSNGDSPAASDSCTSGSSGGCASNGTYSALVSSGANFAGIDQGIDFTPKTTSGFDICAPESGTITQADQTGHHFDRTPGQAEIIERLDQKPNAPNSSQYIYFAEIIKIDSNIKVGTHVSKGDVIGHNNQSPGIEVGWAHNADFGFLCSLGSSLGSQTPCGVSFDAWIKTVSAGKAP
jgi:hypothetical protein